MFPHVQCTKRRLYVVKINIYANGKEFLFLNLKYLLNAQYQVTLRFPYATYIVT